VSIRFSTSTPSLRGLLAPAGFCYRGAVVFLEGCACVCCLPLADIVTEQGQNRLTPLDGLHGRKGVYVVVEDDAALYVGNSTRVTGTWDLRKRIAQHFREKDSGGTLRKNWGREHAGGNYRQFVQAMHRCHLQVISFGEDANDQQVLRLEHLLIGLLVPRYCDMPK